MIPTEHDTDDPPPMIVDCQCHLFTPGTIRRLRDRRTHPRIIRRDSRETVVMGPWRRPITSAHTNLQSLVETMEASGISRNVLSPNDPGPEWFGTDAPEAARESNDFIAEIVHKGEDRFTGVLPLPDIPSTLDEMTRGVEVPGLKGFLLYTNILGHFPDEPHFSGVFRKAEDLV